MRDNIKYMLSNWLKWDRKSLVYFLIRIPALVFQHLVMYIPVFSVIVMNTMMNLSKRYRLVMKKVGAFRLILNILKN